MNLAHQMYTACLVQFHTRLSFDHAKRMKIIYTEHSLREKENIRPNTFHKVQDVTHWSQDIAMCTHVNHCKEDQNGHCDHQTDCPWALYLIWCSVVYDKG